MEGYTVKEVSELFGVSKETVRRWIRAGKLGSEKKSKRGWNLISQDDLLEFVRLFPKHALSLASFLEREEMEKDEESTGHPSISPDFLENSLFQSLSRRDGKIRAKDIRAEIKSSIAICEESIRAKEEKLSQLQWEIYQERSRADTLRDILTNGNLPKMAREINKSRNT